MPPRGRGGRGGTAATAAGGGRTSSRIAEKQEAAQQAEREAAANTPNEPPAETSTPPPAPSRGRGRGRPRGTAAESYARRGTTRGNRGASSLASFRGRSTPKTVGYLGANEGEEPFTPQRADAADMVYGDYWREASELTPRTRDDATANLMNKFVDRLFSVSKDLIGHVLIDHEERDASWIQELNTHKDVFNSFYKIYTMDADPFIDIYTVEKRTKSSNVPILWERMVKSVSSANLASLLSDVEDLDGDPSNVLNRLPLLQRIDEHFPATFTPGGPKGLEEKRMWIIDDGTKDQAFAIRVQRFIETLRGVQQVSSSRLFAKVFLDLDVDNMNDDMFGQYIDGAAYRPFAAFNVNDPDVPKYRDAVNGFRSMLTEMDTAAVISKLEEDYPFDAFLKDLKDWIRTYENRAPGPSRPPAFSHDRDSPFAADAQLQAEARASQQAIPYGVQRLKEQYAASSGIQRLKEQYAAGSAAQEAEEDSIASEAPAYEDFDENVSLSGTDVQMLARSRQLAAQGLMPGNNGQVYAAAAAEAVDVAKRSGGRKRPRKNAGDGDGNAKRSRGGDQVAMPPPPRPAAPFGSLPPAPTAFDPVALSRQSQLISKANRRPAQPKQRKPWTAHDTQQLVTAVNVYKAKWSTIERAIKENHIAFNVPERDQQGLRDKARLVKVDILKTDGVLPPAFDLVVLGRKEKDMVIAAGRNPDRREDDVDANHNPINVLYDPNAIAAVPATAAPPANANANGNGNVGQPEEEAIADGLPPPSSDVHDLRPLQEAQMVAEATMGGGVPDAPMMADMGGPAAPPSEPLGEGHSVIDSDSAVDPSIAEAGPSSVSGQD